MTMTATKNVKKTKPGIYLGVDPGSGGGLASIILTSSGCWRVEACRMPQDMSSLWEWFENWAGWNFPRGYHEKLPVHAVIEKVGGYVATDHDQPGMGNSMFSFGKSFGSLLMALTAANLAYDDVTPQAWQKALGLKRAKGEEDTVWKGRLKAHAKGLFPSEKVTLATADALLLAECCRMTHGTVMG